jgi:hypothetical protein
MLGVEQVPRQAFAGAALTPTLANSRAVLNNKRFIVVLPFMQQ